MKYLFLFCSFFMTMSNSLIIFDFNKDSVSTSWKIVDDTVMGGRSGGNFYINEEGNGVFEGYVSLENNGGFSSVRHTFESKTVANYSKVLIKLKGDGKRYQFRIKSNKNDRHAYISYFETTKDWQSIEISLLDMYPTFRGRKLDMDNFPCENLEEIAFLIANKEAENFKLEIDSIKLQ